MTKINDNVYLGDIFDAQNNAFHEQHGIEHVVTVTSGELPETTRYHPLKDGANDYDEFVEAVQSARDAVETGDPTLIHCTAGQSRSPTIVACVLAQNNGWSFDDALNTIREYRHIHPAPELRELAETYLSRES